MRRATGEWVARAAALTASGALVVVPTETVYGVAARAGDAGAMERLYAAKGRDAGKPVALMAADAAGVRRDGAEWGKAAEKLAVAFWPGALTMVLKKGEGWTGYRVPDHPVALDWLRRLSFLPAVTSANLSGEPAATTAEAAWEALKGRVALVLDDGPSPGGVASAVVRVDGTRVELLRGGALAGALREMAGKEGWEWVER
ncbi:MAG: threonylcarbamoyl-AMP synthase [Kiritimatiellae bacterium]|nr:threonylcarbamoyl-AMP synthase [Kiritimatiellia bacterium]